MSLEGNIKDFSLIEVIKLLGFSKKSGCLSVRKDPLEGKIWVLNGQVTYAESPNENGPLSTRLIRERRLSEKQLRQALGLQKIQKDRSKTLAQILTGEKYIDEKQLEISIKTLIVDSIFEIYLWQEGDFVLLNENEINDDLAVFPLIPEEVEADIIRRNKTWESVVEKIPNFDVVFEMSLSAAEKAAEIRLKPLEWKVLCLLDGEITARKVGEKLKISDYKLGRTLYGLYSVGLIEIPQVGDAVAEEYFPAEEFR